MDSVKVEVTDTSSRPILAEFPLNNFIKDIIRQGENSPYYKERGYQITIRGFTCNDCSLLQKRLNRRPNI